MRLHTDRIIAIDLTEAPSTEDSVRVERFVFTFDDDAGQLVLPSWVRCVTRPRLKLIRGGAEAT